MLKTKLPTSEMIQVCPTPPQSTLKQCVIAKDDNGGGFQIEQQMRGTAMHCACLKNSKIVNDPWILAGGLGSWREGYGHLPSLLIPSPIVVEGVGPSGVEAPRPGY